MAKEEKAEKGEVVESEAEKEEKPQPKEEVEEERVYMIPLGRAWVSPRQARTPRAVRMVRSFIRKHMKSDVVKIDKELNQLMWSRGIEKPPRRVRVRVTKDREGVVTAYLLKGKEA